MKPTPTALTAALAGVLAGTAMPALWSRLAADSVGLVLAFLLVVALPAHAFVVGFGHRPPAGPGALDAALLKRVGAWLCAAVVAVAVAHAFGMR